MFKQKTVYVTLKVRNIIPLWYARYWQNVYRLKNKFFNFKDAYGSGLLLFFLIVLVLTSFFFVPVFQDRFKLYVSEKSLLNSIQALYLTLGGALIGATAIAFSLIMFAMQINVERLPYGLFRKFSSDMRLLSSFVVTFSLAAVVAVLSLIPNESCVFGATVLTAWCLVLIPLFFTFAYRRALTLISPAKQLDLIVNDAEKNFRIWDKAAKRAMPIIRERSKNEDNNPDIRRQYDLDLATYFHLNPKWTISAKQAIYFCITFSRRYAERGDYEVTNIAFHGIITINNLYIKMKGKTFFPENTFITNPFASDSFLNSTLEHLRQNMQIGIARQDEQFITQNLRCFHYLTQSYLPIKYGEVNSAKSHAQLVSTYLADAVESIMPHNMADVLMEGVTILGDLAHLFVQHDDVEHTTIISDRIALIACAGAINKNYQPVTLIAVKQLANLTYELLISKSMDVRFPITEVRDDVAQIAKMYLQTKGAPLLSIPYSVLSAYYSGTSHDALSLRLTRLTNYLLSEECDVEVGQRVIGNIAEWSEKLYRTEKELLLLAIEKRSRFTYDLIHWITHVTKLLLTISCSQFCHENYKKKLRRSAISLMSTLTWIPDDEDSIKYVEGFRIADNLFESVLEANKCGCLTEALEIRKILINWVYKAGKYQTGCATLEKACCALACLNLVLELPDEQLFTEIDTYLADRTAPALEIRLKTASDLREEAEKYRTTHNLDIVDFGMTQVDQTRLKVLLHGIADHLYPR